MDAGQEPGGGGGVGLRWRELVDGGEADGGAWPGRWGRGGPGRAGGLGRPACGSRSTRRWGWSRCIRRSRRMFRCGESSASPTEYLRSVSRTSPDGETAWSTGGPVGPTKSASVGMVGGVGTGRGAG